MAVLCANDKPLDVLSRDRMQASQHVDSGIADDVGV